MPLSLTSHTRLSFKVLSLVHLELPIDTHLELPDLGGMVGKGLKNMAESLQAEVMEELNQLAEDLKDQVGGAADDFMEDAEKAGAGGLLDEVCGMFSDAMAHKHSKMEAWRVREVTTVGFKMMAATPQIKGVVAEEVQGALIKRRAFETNDNVLAVLGATNELPKQLATFAAVGAEPGSAEGGTPPTTVDDKEEEEVAAGGAPCVAVDDDEEEEVVGGAPPSTVDDGEEDKKNNGGNDPSGPFEQHANATATNETVESATDELDAAQTAMALQKDDIAEQLKRRMDELASLEDEARNETDAVRKAVLLVQCRQESNALKKQVQNSADLGAKVNFNKQIQCASRNALWRVRASALTPTFSAQTRPHLR